MPQPKKFGGRPRREPEDGERVHIGFRVTPKTKALVETAASENGRSISQEAELRLEQSFRDDRIESRLDEILHRLKEWK